MQGHTSCVTEDQKYAKGATKPGGFASTGFFKGGTQVLAAPQQQGGAPLTCPCSLTALAFALKEAAQSHRMVHTLPASAAPLFKPRLSCLPLECTAEHLKTSCISIASQLQPHTHLVDCLLQ